MQIHELADRLAHEPAPPFTSPAPPQ
jgi:hypothetical protein